MIYVKSTALRQGHRLQADLKVSTHRSCAQLHDFLLVVCVVEIVAAMAVGLGIGLLIDNYFNTRPIFTLIFFLLGSAAGILNVFRVAKSLQNN